MRYIKKRKWWKGIKLEREIKIESLDNWENEQNFFGHQKINQENYNLHVLLFKNFIIVQLKFICFNFNLYKNKKNK